MPRNDIHPTAIIDDSVTLGEGNTIGPFVVISGAVRIGDGNRIASGCVIGAPPEIRGYAAAAAPGIVGPHVVIGDGVTLREHVQVHAGSHEATTIGDDAFVMNQSYVAHDARVGDGATLAAGVLLAGHVRVGARANLGLGVKVHQFRRIGAAAMVGIGAVVTRDLPPFCLAYGVPARVSGANRVGLERLGADAELVEAIDQSYRGGSGWDLEALPSYLRALVERS